LAKELYTPEEVAVLLKMSKKTVLTWLREGKLKGYRLGKLWRISAESVEELLKGSGREFEPKTHHGQRTFTSAEVLRLTGINRKTLHYWVQEGFITPNLAGKYGTRATRLWSFVDIVALRVMQKLRQAGIDLRSTKIVLLLVENIQKREKIEELPQERVLASDGREVFEVDTTELPLLMQGAGVLLVVHLGRAVAELKTLLAMEG
jgi:excisionase family DNA binding protein